MALCRLTLTFTPTPSRRLGGRRGSCARLLSGSGLKLLCSPRGFKPANKAVCLGRLASGENIFVARNGTLITPPLASGALEGITQDSVTTIARDLGFEVEVGNLARSDVYIAEEMFVCGTAAEVSAVNAVDDRPLPCPGPMTKAIADEYAKAVRGEVDAYKDWLEHVS